MVWDNGYSQEVDSPTRGDAILDMYLVRPEISFTSNSIVQGINDHHRVLLEEDWEENSIEQQSERLIPVYYKTDVVGLQTFLRDRLSVWASNGSSFEQIWNNFKSIIHESVERFGPHKLRKTNSDPEYYNKDVKRLKSKQQKELMKASYGQTETAIQTATLSKETGTGDIPEINSMQRGQRLARFLQIR